MKLNIRLAPNRGGRELRGSNEQALVRSLNVSDEVSAVASKIQPDSINVGGLPPPLFGLNKILVPVDFSNLSEKSLRHAVQFAQRKAGRIILLHVLNPKPQRERKARLRETDGNRMDDAERKLLTLGDHELGSTVKFDILVQSGNPYREIINVATALSVDLIVMGTRGFTKTHSLEGSLAERVVRRAPCPVLVVREQEHNLFWPLPRPRHRQRFHKCLCRNGG